MRQRSHAASSQQITFEQFVHSRFCRTVAGVLAFLMTLYGVPLEVSTALPPGTMLFVSNTDPTCAGQSPCFSTIQAAVDAAQAGDTIRIQAGQYDEAVVIKKKNQIATEAERIVIEADPAALAGSVKLGGASDKCGKGDAISIEASQFITIRGLTVTDAGGQAIVLAGGKKKNNGIRIERNRIVGNGSTKCLGGLQIGKGNANTLIVNNLIYGNGQYALNFLAGKGGPHYVVGNTIHGNTKDGVLLGKDQEVWLINNSITGNGTDPKLGKKDGFGVKRVAPAKKAQPEQALLLNNLICGNAKGELSGAMLDSTDLDNLTPTGSEGPGVLATPTCADLDTIYANRNGADGVPNTLDDDFSLAFRSPAIDRGRDPRTLALGVPAPLLEANVHLLTVGSHFRDKIVPRGIVSPHPGKL
ncbi:MAG: right-handed parallel beta-helix repeat-containing protein [Deltaproteobacteria bacterium]|nr:right-handed parallel beta-helix repeat-containing protein [Deltaproteobacteria bacterium]